MAVTEEDLTTHPLTLTQELILMLLNEETGYFHQVPGWDLNCAVIGAVLAELSLRSRIDTDEESLFLVDETETGNPALDPTLKEIAAEPVQRNTQYWIERLAPRAESIIDAVLDRLVDLKVLEHHESLSVSSTPATSFASCFNLMTRQRSASNSFARWT